MLLLEAPRDMLQITDGTATAEQVVELANPAVWVRTLVRQQKQAEEDMRELIGLCGNTIDQTDQRMRWIEYAYQTLAEGTRYVYDRINANQEIEEAWVHSELAAAANAYQTFTRNVWQAIIERTNEATERQVCQATQLARVNDALAFLGEANTARNQHLATFQGNVELWATHHQQKVAELQQELQQARNDIQRLAIRVPLPPASPSPPPPLLPPLPRSQTPAQQQWRSPARPSSTSTPDPTSRQPSVPSGRPTYQPLRSPIQLNLPSATRRVRPPAIPPILAGHATLPPWQNPHAGGNSGPPSEPPTRLATPPPPPTPTPPPGPETTRPTLTTQDLIQLVTEGVAKAQAHQAPREERFRTSRLKMENPETFDGKPTTLFNTWWQSVVKYLGFYPEISDQQKITWVGTLLTGTAKAWDLHRYTTLGENNTWANYSANIRTEYFNSREPANAQLKLSQLKYRGDI